MADAKKPADEWMPLLVGKYKADTETLTTEQHGAYLLLLMYGWQHEGHLPSKDAALAAITRLSPARWRAHKPILLPYFRDDGEGGLVQKRLLIEVERARHLISVRSKAGEASARSRSRPEQTPNKTGTHVPETATETATKAEHTTQQTANTTAAKGATHLEQMGDYRGSPNPSSTASTPPDTDTDTDRVRGLSRALTPAGEACRAMRDAGMADVNPANPTLLEMLRQGMTKGELADAARTAVDRGKGFAWALTRAAGQRADAAKVALAPVGKPTGIARFMTPSALPVDLPSLEMNEQEAHDDDAEARRG